MKPEKFREDNEWLSQPYSNFPCINSAYYALLNHHREKPFDFSNAAKYYLNKFIWKNKSSAKAEKLR
jgi:hypothetical protein